MLSSTPNPQYGAAISPLHLDVFFETADRIHMKISDPNNGRWEVPQSILPTPYVSEAPSSLNYVYSNTSAPFGMAVMRTSDSAVLFNTSTLGLFNGLVFSEQYLEISTQLPAHANIYGLGEHVTSFRLDGSGANGHSYTMWSRDVPTPPESNLYGVHPFYLEMRDGSVFYKAVLDCLFLV